jgi:hypothetical protein
VIYIQVFIGVVLIIICFGGDEGGERSESDRARTVAGWACMYFAVARLGSKGLLHVCSLAVCPRMKNASSLFAECIRLNNAMVERRSWYPALIMTKSP